eukprot:5073642-Pleurochrysis_carterae.AAC.4
MAFSCARTGSLSPAANSKSSSFSPSESPSWRSDRRKMGSRSSTAKYTSSVRLTMAGHKADAVV